MSSAAATLTDRTTERVIVHTPTDDGGLTWRLTASNDYEWIRAKQRAERQLREVMVDLTQDTRITRRASKSLRQWIYEMRSRVSLLRDFARVLDVVRIADECVSRPEAWAYVDRIQAVERALAVAAIGPRVPAGPRPDKPTDTSKETLLTCSTQDGAGNPTAGRGVLMGALDDDGAWTQSRNGRDWGRAA